MENGYLVMQHRKHVLSGRRSVYVGNLSKMAPDIGLISAKDLSVFDEVVQ
jgi:hypothetical protein